MEESSTRVAVFDMASSVTEDHDVDHCLPMSSGDEVGALTGVVDANGSDEDLEAGEIALSCLRMDLEPGEIGCWELTIDDFRRFPPVGSSRVHRFFLFRVIQL